MSENDPIHLLRHALGDEAVLTAPQDIVRVLKDQSWLSPVLQQTLDERKETGGDVLGVKAVVVPRTEDEVVAAAGIAARARLPITLRGAGTSNFGLVTPEHGGLLFDLRGLSGEVEFDGTIARAPAGTFQGAIERAARARGREMPVLTTTYATATAAGWIAGGHVGLGSSVHGSVWDGLIKSVRIVTVEEEPRVLTLTDDEVIPVLHTFGAAGIVTEVSHRTAEAREWIEAVGFFPTFEQAAAFATVISQDTKYRHRVAAAQEEELMAGMTGLSPIIVPGAGVLLILDAENMADAHAEAARHGGTIAVWQTWQQGGARLTGKQSIAGMVYGHRMLWVKRLLPEAAFIHVYFDPKDPMAGLRLLKERFGNEMLMELKFVRSPWMSRILGFDPTDPLPAAVVSVRKGSPAEVAEVLAFCDGAGLRYQNSHTNVIEDTGMFPDVSPIVSLKAETDPYNLLARGRLRSAKVRA